MADLSNTMGQYGFHTIRLGPVDVALEHDRTMGRKTYRFQAIPNGSDQEFDLIDRWLHTAGYPARMDVVEHLPTLIEDCSRNGIVLTIEPYPEDQIDRNP